MTRAEHLAWCKERALEYVELGQNSQAFASMISDLTKFSEPMYRAEIMHVLMRDGLALAESHGPEASSRMKHWIEGFN